MANTDTFQKSISEEPASPEVREPAVTASRSAWPPVVWAALGLIAGVGGAAIVLVPKNSAHRQVVAVASPPAIGTLDTSAPTSFEKNLSPADPAKAISTVPPKPTLPATAKSAPVLGTSSAPEAFSRINFVIPKPPPVLPMQPPPLKGVIFHGGVPLAPSVRLVPVSPGGPKSEPAKGSPAPSKTSPSTPGQSGYLKKLIGQGLPAAPPALNTSAANPSPASAPVAQPGPAKLVTVNDLATDRDACIQAVTAFAKKNGGSAHPLVQVSEGKTVTSGVLISVPDAVLDDFVKSMSGTGQVRDREFWTGSVERRRAKLAADGEALIASLKKLREALLATYLPDSDPVKDTDKDIAHANEYAKDLLPPDGSDGMTLVRVNFVVY